MEFKSNIPIYLQVIDDIKHKVVDGSIKLGDKLPSTRELAVQYQINPNTAVRVYNEMESMGLCFTKRGLGTYFSESEGLLMQIKEEMSKDVLEEFIEGMKNLGYTPEEMIREVEKYLAQREA